MKFQYSEKKVRLPENVHAYAEKKVMKLARFFEEDAEALIVFSVEKNRNNVELTVHGAGTWFRASESTSDMFASIDAAVGTIEGQIRKNKTRLARRLRQDAFTRTAEGCRRRQQKPRLHQHHNGQQGRNAQNCKILKTPEPHIGGGFEVLRIQIVRHA